MLWADLQGLSDEVQHVQTFKTIFMYLYIDTQSCDNVRIDLAFFFDSENVG